MTNFELLAQTAISDIGDNPGIIGIDGIDGIGKTTLGKLIAERLNIPLVSLDEHLDKDQNKYIEALRTSAGEDIESFKGSGVVEGVCLLAAAKRFGFDIGTLIYLKEIHLGAWVDKKLYEHDCGPDEAIASAESELLSAVELMRKVKSHPYPKSGVKLSGLRKELIRYHHTYRPHRRAKLVYEVEHT